MPGTRGLTRKQVERESRRQYILDATRGLLARKGIENTRMEDIAAAAGYTRRTLYAYFKSRDEVFLLLFCEDLSRRWTLQQNVVAEAGTGLAKITAWGESFYAYVRENPLSLQLQAYWDYKGIDRSRISKSIFIEFETLNTDLADSLRDIFRQGVRDGSLLPDLHIDLSISQYLYSLRAILQRALSPSYSFAMFEPQSYVSHYLDLFNRAIRNRGGQSTCTS